MSESTMRCENLMRWIFKSFLPYSTPLFEFPTQWLFSPTIKTRREVGKVAEFLIGALNWLSHCTVRLTLQRVNYSTLNDIWSVKRDNSTQISATFPPVFPFLNFSCSWFIDFFCLFENFFAFCWFWLIESFSQVNFMWFLQNSTSTHKFNCSSLDCQS